MEIVLYLFNKKFYHHYSVIHESDMIKRCKAIKFCTMRNGSLFWYVFILLNNLRYNPQFPPRVWNGKKMDWPEGVIVNCLG